ncbi:MAG: nucleotidyltransferase domain-containing protein [Deltaproteobacteria bacterium]|nr:MAG: nucleotidyltransferase domain-containing protein [Deltaproteobacteria bacterium]
MIKYQPLPSNIYELIEEAGHYLASRADIAFAYLFGSLARGRAFPLSDVDIAVYLEKETALTMSKMALLGDLIDILHTDEIDLVVLNQAPVSLIKRILSSKKVIVDRNPSLRQKFESVMMRLGFDFSFVEKRILERRYMCG